jgi:hypothetical protein
MKMVKSLLLGSAAGLVALTGAQAADLPVKAKPVQYVKVCSLYGAGFYYIPGTDMCIKIGGWVRFEAAWGDNGNLTNGPFPGNVNNRTTNNLTWRSRGYITADARDQTAYGTVRGYLAVGINTSSVGADTATNTFSSNRAFIQWAGFTFGLAQSFYDFYSVPATSYWGSFPASDTGDPGWQTAGYTFQFGNGLSATISVEQRRTTQIVGQPNAVSVFSTTTGALAPAPLVGAVLPGTTGFPTAGYGGWQAPDIVGNLRVDQTWGSAQIMGAAHQVNAGYYGSLTTAVPGLGTPVAGSIEGNGGPDSKWGFAVGAGLKLNTPWLFQGWGWYGQGDYFQAQVNYTQGATRYVFFTPEFNYGFRNGNSAAFGVLSDAVYGGLVSNGTATDLELTTAWNVNAAYEHFWSPAWRTSVYGGYAAISYGSQANAMLCGLEGQAVGTGIGAIGSNAVAAAGCGNNWNTSWIGSRTQWNVTKDFYMGVDVLYQHLSGASTVTGQVPVGVFGLTPANLGQTTFSNSEVNNWSFRFRAHRDFYP